MWNHIFISFEFYIPYIFQIKLLFFLPTSFEVFNIKTTKYINFASGAVCKWRLSFVKME